MASNKLKDGKRKVVGDKKKIQEYWYKEVTNNKDDFIEMFGDDCYCNILLDNGSSCYACGKSDKHLYRCHIKPRALGGDNESSNIFLMCHDCHCDNPDTIYRDLFEKYVKNRRPHSTMLFEGIKHNLDYLLAGATDEELTKWSEFGSLGVWTMLEIMMESKIDKTSVSMYNKMSIATMVGGIWKQVTDPAYQPYESAELTSL